VKIEKGSSYKINDQFSIHIAEDTDQELEAIINLNLAVHQEEILKPYIRRIFYEYPKKKDIYWLYILDDKKNKMVSSICLVPLIWQLKRWNLPVCEMEFVGTLEEYRGRGFIKELNQLYEEIMLQNGYLLSVIRGIPYYYRSLGYEFFSSLDERITLPISNIPTTEFQNINIRKANSDDLAFIESKYNEFHKDFHIFNKFDPKCFAFKYLNDNFNTETRSTYIIEVAGEKNNYFSFGLSYDGKNYEVVCPNLNQIHMIKLLQFIKNYGKYSLDDVITLSLSEVSSLYNYIKSLGGNSLSSYGWQVKIPNLKLFFNSIKPVLEERIKRSSLQDITKSIKISNYTEKVELMINQGEIYEINIEKGYPNPENTDLRIPGALLYKLLLGDKTIDELNYIIKDAMINPLSKSLIEIMFPKKTSLLGSYI
jgi:predicted acetyltransferase